MSNATDHNDGGRGLLAAGAITGAWAASVASGLLGITSGTAAGATLVVLHVCLTTFLATGLFITAHDAIHGLVAPGRPRLNRAVGTFAMLAYAGMSFRRMAPAHHRHHAHTGTVDDPDHHEHRRGGLLGWYVGFMREHATWQQVVFMAVAFNILHHLGAVPLGRLWVFWIVPHLLSSVQLFVVGTWLPHRRGAFEGDPRHHARSLDLPVWASLLACYHFGYHYEHHDAPSVPWWRLPAYRRARLGDAGVTADRATA